MNTDVNTDNVYELLQYHIKEAMISKNTVKRDVLRCVVSEIKNRTVNAGKEIDNKTCYDVVKKMIKQHNDSIAQFNEAGRTDLVAKESLELSYIKIFEPYVLNETETKVFVLNVINQNNIEPIKKNKGMVMKHLKNNSSIDMKIALKVVDDILVD